VLLVDDHELVRQGLIIFLKTANIAIVGEAADGCEAIRLADQQRPDVVLMDLVMPGMDGIEATRRIKAMHPPIEVLALTSYIDEEKVLDALSAGAAGYVMKDVSPGELVRAIQAAAAGQVYLSPAAASYLAAHVRPRREPAPNPDALTARELEVLQRIARGLSNQAIAEDLQISPKTVKAHVGAILQKLHLENRTEVAVYALQQHLVQPD
jgi:NarL family two-component system response regulator LiaR